ncbi:V-type ATP synthase subunit I [Anaerocolumna sp. AGMB13020]|uniref:V-type ATP synthase subunit I n=1 Tax=Anaerocolumna sp. AGMB13020 TaxID=3081750 RepID=UPI002954A3EA|nr:V-type ATP synthase subunit I [Anaerocolumna sp. AGMB13020]WOO37657.1 V-type ATP synthase subunit I [Anaerocolumna sp. AGMB13020]
MAVEKMKKLTIITFKDVREVVLKEFQKAGNIHFKELELSSLPTEYLFLSKAVPIGETKLTEHKTVVENTIKALNPYVPKKKLTDKRLQITYEECCSYLDNTELEELHKAVRSILDRKDSLSQEYAKRKTENTQLEPYAFLEFPVSELKKLSKFYAVLLSVRGDNQEELEELEKEFPEAYLEKLGRIKQEVVYLFVNSAEQSNEVRDYLNQHAITILDLVYEKKPVELIQSNQERMNIIQEEIELCKEELQKFGADYDKVLIEKDAITTCLSRDAVVNNFLNSNAIVYMEGWIPEENLEELKEILETVITGKYYINVEEVDSEDLEVPVKLKNKGLFAAFESITEMFSLPRYNELDPTGILAVFYLVFFGMMVGDAGYGILLTAACFCILKFVDMDEKRRKSIQLFFYLGIAVIFGGILYGSMFGLTFFAPIPVKGGGHKAILDTQSDIVIMLVLSMAIGVIHIFSGLVMKALNCYKQKDYAGIICDSVLWILTLSSGILLLLRGAGIMNFGTAKIYGMFFGACIVGLAATQGRSSKSIGGKIGGGLYGVYGLSSYIGDIVSYTRIVALGLSGAYIAYSFNLLSGLIPGTIGRILFGTVVAVFGQSLNFGLSLLGAYVHSCRLQYVEFFGKFYNGGGKAYRPFKIENKNITIKK